MFTRIGIPRWSKSLKKEDRDKDDHGVYSRLQVIDFLSHGEPVSRHLGLKTFNCIRSPFPVTRKVRYMGVVNMYPYTLQYREDGRN